MVMLKPSDIKELREFLGLTRKEFAARVGVSDVTVWCWEAGTRHPTYRHLVRLNEIRDEARKTLPFQTA